jgi:hypothetical protein
MNSAVNDWDRANHATRRALAKLERAQAGIAGFGNAALPQRKMVADLTI